MQKQSPASDFLAVLLSGVFITGTIGLTLLLLHAAQQLAYKAHILTMIGRI